jgi:hypothetical protein
MGLGGQAPRIVGAYIPTYDLSTTVYKVSFPVLAGECRRPTLARTEADLRGAWVSWVMDWVIVHSASLVLLRTKCLSKDLTTFPGVHFWPLMKIILVTGALLGNSVISMTVQGRCLEETSRRN